MAAPTEDLPPGFTLSSTTGRSRAYDLLLREAGRILNQPNRVPLSPRRRTRRTKRHTPVRPARRARQANVTTSQPAVPFPSSASSQGPFSLPDPPLQSAEEAAASILCTTLLAQTPSSPPTPGNERDRNARQHVEESSIPGDQEQVHASNLSSSSREHTTPPLPAPPSPQASDENSSQLTTAAEPSASASPGPPLTLPKGKEARRCRPSCEHVHFQELHPLHYCHFPLTTLYNLAAILSGYLQVMLHSAQVRHPLNLHGTKDQRQEQQQTVQPVCLPCL
ncbi:hypothetical protein HPB50_028341 [Hyalomma asiaticum]|nr:hypothetical protein HPB50_028341 [Hyalomma asiaticum]